MKIKALVIALCSMMSLAYSTFCFAQPLNIVLIGPPASGKGTQGELIEKSFGIPKISTGDLLRKEIQKATPEAKALKQTMDSGELVPDKAVLTLLAQRLKQSDTEKGFILDGFPRTQGQAKQLKDMGVNIDTVLVLDVPDEILISRISGRRVHLASGRTYHIELNPPKQAGLDDETGDPLIQRKDDTPEVIQQRLKIYHEQTQPVVDWYQAQADEGLVQLWRLDGTQDVERLKKTIAQILSHTEQTSSND